jgi:hypothetical protein
MAGTDRRLMRRLSDTGKATQRGSDMENLENLLLFILSSSSCMLVASVVLLLRPLTAMP